MDDELKKAMMDDLIIESNKVSTPTMQLMKDKLEQASADNWRKLQELNDPHPITSTDTERYQDKEREVYCPNCKYTAVTKLMGPKCSACHSWMICVPKQSINLTE